MADRNQHPLVRIAVGLVALAAVLVSTACGPDKAASCWPVACPSDSPAAEPAPVIDAAPPTGLGGPRDLDKGPVLYYGLYDLTPEGRPYPGLRLAIEASAIPTTIDVITPDGVQVPSPAFLGDLPSPGALRVHFLPQATAMEFVIHANINHGATLRCWATQDGVPIPGVEDFDEDEAALGFGVLAVTCTVPNLAA